MLEYSGGSRGGGLFVSQLAIFLLFSLMTLCDLLPTPGSSDVLIKSDLHKHKAEEEAGIYFKRLTDPVVTLMEFGLRAGVLGGAFLLWGLRSRCSGWRPVPRTPRCPGEQGMLSLPPTLPSASVWWRTCCPLKCSLSHFIYLVKYELD